MSWHYDLRPLYLNDPFSHSAIYDAQPGTLVLTDGGLTTPGTRRVALPPLTLSEAAFQQGLAELLVASAGALPEESTPAGLALRALKGCAGLLTSPATIRNTFEALYDEWVVQSLLFEAMPRKLETWFKLFYRPVYLHAAVPEGIVLAVGSPEHVGWINTPSYFPLPARACCHPGAARAFRLVKPTLESVLRSGRRRRVFRGASFAAPLGR